MKPDTLRLMLGLLRPGQVVTCAEVWKKDKAAHERERIRQWLDELSAAGLVERREQTTESGYVRGGPARVCYRLIYKPIS